MCFKNLLMNEEPKNHIASALRLQKIYIVCYPKMLAIRNEAFRFPEIRFRTCVIGTDVTICVPELSMEVYSRNANGVESNLHIE